MLKDGGTVVIAEGYLWELERRGFLQFGRFGPEVVLDNPHIVKSLHEEFAHAGSDVIEAFTVRSCKLLHHLFSRICQPICSLGSSEKEITSLCRYGR